MTITHFLHATLLVEDIAKAEAFYEGFLGLKPIPRNLTFEGRWYQIGATQLHLITAERVIDDLVQPEKWGRNRHLALAVTDLSPIQKKLEGCGYEYQHSSSGRPAVFIRDPDGNLIELFQTPSETLSRSNHS